MAYWPAAQRQPTALDYISKGLDTIMGIANFVQQFKANRQLSEGRELDQATKQVGLMRSANPDQDIDVPEKLGKKLAEYGIAQPQRDPMAQQQAASEALLASPYAQTERKLSTPETAPAREALVQQAFKSAPVTGYRLPAAKKTVAVIQRGGGVKAYQVPASTAHIGSEPAAGTQYGIFQPGKGIIPTGNVRTTMAPKATYHDMRVGDKVVTIRENPDGTREQVASGEAFAPEKDTTLVDPTYGLPTGTIKGKVQVLPAPKQDPTQLETIADTTKETPMGPERSQTITRKVKPEAPGTAPKSGIGIKGLGGDTIKIQTLPEVGKQIRFKNGMTLLNDGKNYTLVYPDNRRQVLSDKDIQKYGP